MTEETAPPLRLDDYAQILRRNRGWIAGPLFAALVVSVVTAFLWPDTYVSSAIIRVAPPQVPETFVPRNTSQDLQGRVNALVQLILNRATLTNIINTHGLYRHKLARMPLDDVIEDMKRSDIQVIPVRQGLNAGQHDVQYPAFEIRFAYSDRFMAQKVTADLVARFLEENVREVSQQTVSTTEFLEDRWQESKKKLEALEQRLSVFRTQNIGRLPEEQQNNYQQLAGLQTQKLNLTMTMNRVNQERLLYENQLRIYRDELASLKDPNAPEQAASLNDERLRDQDREIAQYEDQLASAREKYKENHPDVERLVNLLAAARAQREAILKQEQPKAEHRAPQAASAQFLREQRELEAESERTKGLILAKGVEMEDYRKQSSEVDGIIRNYEARIESTPVGIREYDELIRDRDLAKKDYEELDRRLSSSALSTALQNRQQGERLEQLDPPSLPQTPVRPKRAWIVSAGAGIGLILGLCIAGWREMRDSSLHSVEEVGAYSALPVIGNIPLLEAPAVVRRRRRMLWLGWSTSAVTGAAAMLLAAAHYYLPRT